jgi:hypothetical protein
MINYQEDRYVDPDLKIRQCLMYLNTTWYLIKMYNVYISVKVNLKTNILVQVYKPSTQVAKAGGE